MDSFRILIVDDNHAIHEDFVKILTGNFSELNDDEIQQLENKLFEKSAGINLLPHFEVDSAYQGQEAIEKVKSSVAEGRPYALIFVDVRLPPGFDGIETIKRIWEIDNSIQIVICTAYSDYTWEQTVEELGSSHNLLILKKPFESFTVRQLASTLTNKWELAQHSRQYTLTLELRDDVVKNPLPLTRATLASLTDGVVIINEDKKIQGVNHKFLKLWNFNEDQIKRLLFNKLLDEIVKKIEEPKEFLMQVQKLEKNSELIIIGELKLKDNRIIEYFTQPNLVNNQKNGRVWSFRDITKKASLEKELQYQATHDLLSNLPNRILLVDRMTQGISKSKRNNHIMGVLFINLDRFKLINDSLGYEAGDFILREVAKRLRKTVREIDTVARIGGDEFVMILNDINDEQYLIDVANKLMTQFDKPYKWDKTELIVTASVGISLYPKDAKTINELLRYASMAMYNAKEQGANQYKFYTEDLNKISMQRLNGELSLREALAKGEFYLDYQPEYDLLSRKLLSFEALIRWNHPEKGIIYPLDFIPLAEETGLIMQIGEWALRTACKQNKAWQEKGLPYVRMAVNITRRQFQSEHFIEMVSRILSETKLDPRYLELELNEKMLINNLEGIKKVKQLKSMRVPIVLDDFGIGYSNLSILKDIPIDRIKIDQSYIHNIGNTGDNDAFIQAIISMANGLNVKVAAEGVESQHQLNFLEEQKCGEVQGYYLSNPISPQACERLLRENAI